MRQEIIRTKTRTQQNLEMTTRYLLRNEHSIANCHVRKVHEVGRQLLHAGIDIGLTFHRQKRGTLCQQVSSVITHGKQLMRADLCLDVEGIDTFFPLSLLPRTVKG